MIRHGGNINARDEGKQTPLMWAAMWKYPKTVGVLLEHKANVNEQDAHGMTALYISIQNSSKYSFPKDLKTTDIVRQLLAHGADPNLSGKDIFTVLQIAHIDRPDLIGLLKQYGAK